MNSLGLVIDAGVVIRRKKESESVQKEGNGLIDFRIHFPLSFSPRLSWSLTFSISHNSLSRISSGGFPLEADVNQDGAVNFSDITPLIAIFTAN